MKNQILLLSVLLLLSFSCDDGAEEKDQKTERNFSMGFSTWTYGPELSHLLDTYDFIEAHADIYSEHLDNKIPWSSYINDTDFPSEFIVDLDGRVERRISSNKLLLSVSLLNIDRSGLIEDYDGSTPDVATLDDPILISAYTEHLEYLIGRLDPDYLVMAMEVNELLVHDESAWEEYLSLMEAVRSNIKSSHPQLPLSASMTLHNWYQTDASFSSKLANYANQQDFAAISFYPFFKGLHDSEDFQLALDFLHSQVTVPVAFVETNHLAEDLIVPGLSLNIPSSEMEQAYYLEVLLDNAQVEDYEFIIWWASRDYDLLWETFPEEVKDVGQLWRDTGLLDEDGKEREAYFLWEEILAL